MGFLSEEMFVCLDCETTGLEPKIDRIIEVAVVRFNLSEELESFETLIDPEIPIPEASTAIHHITQEMVQGKPKIRQVLPQIIQMACSHIVIGHAIQMDLSFLAEAAEKNGLSHPFRTLISIDTVRLARLYGGENADNSLETLGKYFNTEMEEAHRAMGDVMTNIRVFKYLIDKFKTTDQILERLKKPILLKAMPLGKHKGRSFSDIPLEYLQKALHWGFDQDLKFSILTELQKRKKGNRFQQAANPFLEL